MLQSSNFKSLSIKCASYISWLLTLKYIVRHRGHKTFGSQEVIKALDFYRFNWKSNRKDQLMASALMKQIKHELVPIRSPLELTRIGPHYDAGYYSHEFKSPLFILSGGAGKNIDFELHFAKRNASVVIYDPTISNLPVSHQNITHKKFLLGKVGSNKRKSLSFHELILSEQTNLEKNDFKILKLDIEGSELSLLGSESCNLDIFDEIVIEIHDLYRILDSRYRSDFNILLSNLLRWHKPVMTSANNNGVKFCIGNDACPEIIEVILLNKKYFSQETNKYFEVPLPMTNNIERIDFSF